jgi:pyrroline-5-carboxylate reductase
MTKPIFPGKILIFGCGNMAGAMLRGWIASGIEPDRFHIVKPTATGLPDGVHYYANVADAAAKKDVAKFDIMLLGIKPQMLGALAAQAGGLLSPQSTVISILAGAQCRDLQCYFPGAHIIRLMPNLAVEIGKSPLGLWADGLTSTQHMRLNAWLSPLGTPVWLNAENQMDALAALAGCGPAFLYRFIDALAQAGASLGLDPAQSAQLALSMTEGAALLAAHAHETPAQLAARVSSPGGMTQAGLDVLDDDGVLAQLMKTTLSASVKRGQEMAQLTKGEAA